MPYLYDPPDKINYRNVDFSLRELIKEINSSTWLKTEESCAGHPAYERILSPVCDPLYLDVYIRFVVAEDHMIPRLLWMIGRIRDSYPNWHASLHFDREDRDGTHWCFYLNYGRDLSMRDAAIDLILRKFKESEFWNNLLEQKELEPK